MKSEQGVRPNTLLPLAASALCLALAPLSWPYGYYQLLRFGITAVAVYYCWQMHLLGYSISVWFFGMVAVLFNPLMPIYLDRAVWAVIDVALAVVFVVYIVRFAVRRTRQTKSGIVLQFFECPKCGTGALEALLPEDGGRQDRIDRRCSNYPHCDFGTSLEVVAVECHRCGFVGAEKLSKAMRCLKCGTEFHGSS